MFFVAPLAERRFFKESPAFSAAHTCTDLIWRKRNMQWYKKIWTNQFEVKKYLVNFIKSKNEQTGVLISLRPWRYFEIIN